MTSSETTPNPNGSQQETFKEQLDRAAEETRSKANEKPNPIVEKSMFSAAILPKCLARSLTYPVVSH
jgi:hypothetical protein